MSRQTLSQRTALKYWIASGSIYADECAPPPVVGIGESFSQPSKLRAWATVLVFLAACALATVPWWLMGGI